jgi:PKHD-type hydroxylase
MIITIEDFIKPEQIAQMRAIAESGEFHEGKNTVNDSYKLIKNNMQLNDRAKQDKIADIVIENIISNKEVFSATRPFRYRIGLVAHYTKGMSYGRHIDGCIMGKDHSAMRSDISMTIWLNNANEYEGGHLLIEDPAGNFRHKMNAGDVVIYPTTTLHQVEEVTSGERWVMVMWIQSVIRSPYDRKVLFDLEKLMNSIYNKEGYSTDFILIESTFNSLLRQKTEINY